MVVAECEPVQSRLIEAFEKRGMVLGKGYGPFKAKHIRIANFPTHSREQIELLCDLIDRFE